MNESKIRPVRCLIVDHDALSREFLMALVEHAPELQSVSSKATVKDALKFAQAISVDVIFLDVEMASKEEVFQFQNLATKPEIVLTTEQDRYARLAMELHAFDYILKPVSRSRFAATTRRLKRHFEQKEMAARYEKLMAGTFETYLIRCGKETHRVMLADVMMIESMGEYVRFHTRNSKYLMLHSLKKLASELPHSFIQIHRSYIINRSYVSSRNRQEVCLNGEMVLPIGKTYRSKLVNNPQIFSINIP